MKTFLFLTKKRIYLLCFLLISSTVFSQNLVRYPLTNNLNPAEGPAPGLTIPGVDLIQYIDPPTQITPTNYTFNYLNFNNNDDEVRLTFDATSYQGMSVQFTGGIGVLLGFASGNIKVYLKNGAGAETLLDNQNLSANFFGIDTHDFSLALTGSDNQSLVQIRIVGSSSSFSLLSFFGIKNLRIASNNTTMSVRRDIAGYPNISHQSSASVPLETDFGSLLTNEEIVDKVYRITNTGARTLNISSIDVAPNTEGFSIVGTPPSSIGVGNYSTFTVRFAPIDQGLKVADVRIISNALPNNPFTFQVKGNGKSCNLDPVPISFYNFEVSGSTLPITLIGGTPGLTGGNSNAPNPTTLGSPFFPTDTNLYATGSSSRSLFVRGNANSDQNGLVGTGEVILEFGPLDLTGQQEVSVNFDLAAFGSTASNSGVNGYDNVILQVLNLDGITWSDQIRLNGSESSTTDEWASRSYKYGFGGALIPTPNPYGTLNTTNNTASTKYGKFKLNIPAAALTSTFKFRIKARTGRYRNFDWGWKYYNRNLWLIDNVHVDAGNAIFKTWSGSSWTGGRPSPREKAKFSSNYDFTLLENIDLQVCECEVDDGVNLTVPNGIMLQVQNSVINNGSGNNFIVNDGGNLIQIENGALNSGSITAQKLFTFTDDLITPANDRKQYNYVISPVVGQNIKTIYPGTNTVISYKESTNFFINSDGPYIPGRGLAIKEPTKVAVPAGTTTANYVGVPFNGILGYPLEFTTTATPANQGYNLVGNPYPSNLDINKLYAANSAKIDATFYFWDNRGNTVFAQQGSGYSGDNYAKYNASAGTGTSIGTVFGTERIPTKDVKVGTAFIVQAKSTAHGRTLNFNNAMRSSDNSGPGFLGKSAQNEDKDRYWLTLKTPTEIEFMTAVVYLDHGSKAIGPEDTETFGGSDDIFTIVDDKNLAIQGRDKFEENDKVDLGLSLFKTGIHTISIYDEEGIFTNGQTIYLKDKLTGTITNLSQGSYTFEANKGLTEGRFEIIYKPETVLVTDSKVKDGIVVYRDSDNFVVQAPKIIATVEVYDLSGKLITVLKANTNQAVLNASFFNKGMYVLRIKTIDGEITNKKIIK